MRYCQIILLTFGATPHTITLGATQKEVQIKVANKKMGRPTDSPKVFMLRVKMDQSTLDKLDESCKLENTNRSELVRKQIHEKHASLVSK